MKKIGFTIILFFILVDYSFACYKKEGVLIQTYNFNTWYKINEVCIDNVIYMLYGDKIIVKTDENGKVVTHTKKNELKKGDKND